MSALSSIDVPKPRRKITMAEWPQALTASVKIPQEISHIGSHFNMSMPLWQSMGQYSALAQNLKSGNQV